MGWSVFGLRAQLSGFDDIVNVARGICLLLGGRVGSPISVDNELQRKGVSRVHSMFQVSGPHFVVDSALLARKGDGLAERVTVLV